MNFVKLFFIYNLKPKVNIFQKAKNYFSLAKNGKQTSTYGLCFKTSGLYSLWKDYLIAKNKTQNVTATKET